MESGQHSDTCSAALPSYPRPGDEKVRELDAADAAHIRAARHAGHSRLLATVAFKEHRARPVGVRPACPPQE